MTAVQEIIAFCGNSKELAQVKEYAELMLEKEEKQCDNAYDKGIEDEKHNSEEMLKMLDEINECGYDFGGWDRLEKIVSLNKK